MRDIRSDQGPKSFRQSALLDQRCVGHGFSGLAGALAFRWWWLCPSFRVRGVELLSSYIPNLWRVWCVVPDTGGCHSQLQQNRGWGGAWHLCYHQMSQPGGTVKHLITWVSALFSKEHFSRTWYAGWAHAVTSAVFTLSCEVHAS